MTVTSFLLFLLAFVGGCALGAALYQWHLIKRIKSAIKSLINDVEDRLDFHEVTLQGDKKLTVSRSMMYADQYVITIENSSKSLVCYVDPNTLELTSHGTVEN